MTEAPVVERLEYLSPVEAARRLGVSVKALRVYERRGLITPQRTEKGWRVYGPEAVARLYQILALKRLGLPLARIAEIQARGPVALGEVLTLHEAALADDLGRVERALALVRSARSKIASGADLSIDDLTTLAKETNVTKTMTEEEWKDVFDPLAKKHYSEQELESLKARKVDAVTQADVQQRWADIIAEATGMMERGVDPASPEAIHLARRWKALQEMFTQGDPTITQKAAAMWKDAMSDPEAAPKLPMNMALWGYVAKAGEALKAAGG